MLSEQPVPKKPKVATDSGTKSSQSGPSVVISEALANFFGVGGREMLQSEVLQRIWEYIKVNRLEVGSVPYSCPSIKKNYNHYYFLFVIAYTGHISAVSICMFTDFIRLIYV